MTLVAEAVLQIRTFQDIPYMSLAVITHVFFFFVFFLTTPSKIPNQSESHVSFVILDRHRVPGLYCWSPFFLNPFCLFSVHFGLTAEGSAVVLA